ncbi:MAG: ribosome maturation factor RimP [Candidatus Acetothermia bacterium]
MEDTVSESLAAREEDLYLLRWEKRGARWVLEVLLDKDEPVTTADCAEVSDLISAGLDETGVIDRSYELQVSSPGIERPLIESRHYQGAINRTVEIKTYGKIKGVKKFVGVLRGYDEKEDQIFLEYEGEEIKIPISSVAKATTKITEEEED